MADTSSAGGDKHRIQLQKRIQKPEGLTYHLKIYFGSYSTSWFAVGSIRMNNEVPFQFGIRRLMFVTCLVALVMAVAIRIGIVAQTFFGCILLFLCVWAFFRGRGFVAMLKKVHKQRHDVLRRRAQLEEELQLALRSRNSVEFRTESAESRRHDDS